MIKKEYKSIGIDYWFRITYDWLVRKDGSRCGAVIRFRWIKGQQRQWVLEFYRNQ